MHVVGSHLHCRIVEYRCRFTEAHVVLGDVLHCFRGIPLEPWRTPVQHRNWPILQMARHHGAGPVYALGGIEPWSRLGGWWHVRIESTDGALVTLVFRLTPAALHQAAMQWQA